MSRGYIPHVTQPATTDDPRLRQPQPEGIRLLLSRCWGTQYPLLRRPLVLNSTLRRENTKTCTIPNLSQHYISNINSFHLVRIRGSWVFSLQPARVGSGKLGEGMINQHSMFLLGFFRFSGGRRGKERRGEGEREREGVREGGECGRSEPNAYTQQSDSTLPLRSIGSFTFIPQQHRQF